VANQFFTSTAKYRTLEYAMKSLLHIVSTLAAAASLLAADDIVIADFEGPDYGAWQTTGEAFGNAPAQGTLPGQMKVDGFAGKGLANSFNGRDHAKGRLTSPPFQIERKFISFLIGGGGWANETCMNLLVDGAVVRTTTGPNTQPGGGETLDSASWDVSGFAGRTAVIEIVDERQGGWGHINADQIIQTDTAPPPPVVPLERRVQINADYLQLPLLQRPEGKMPGIERFTIEDGGKILRFLHLQIAAKDQKPDFWYSCDVRAFRGREVTFRFKSRDTGVLGRLQLSDKEIIDPKAYTGPHRPRFHFSPRLGWMNDVNGAYCQDGLYHLFYQANPTTAGRSGGFDMHWGHSVSKDLVHWEEWPVALFPDQTGNCFSGTAALINKHIPGVNDGAPLPTPALFFTATSPSSQHLATSADGGRTWKRYPGNPVLPMRNRDPKVFWHEPSKHYVMLLYVAPEGDGSESYTIFRSANLTAWEKVGAIPQWYECPEFLPVKSAVTGEDLWLLYGSWRSSASRDAQVSIPSAFQLGRFDGTTFTPVSDVQPAHRGPNFYGALTFAHQPQSRPIMMAWARGTEFPGEPFNQCATVPLELSLRAFDGKDALCFEPAAEIDALRGRPLLQLENVPAADAARRLRELAKDAPLDVTVTFKPASRDPVRFSIRDITMDYHPATNTIQRGNQNTVIHPPDGSVTVRFLLDRGIVECFWNGGEAAYAIGSLHTADGPAFAIGGNATIEKLAVHPLADIWK
jgi:fructan beta-fructosidase